MSIVTYRYGARVLAEHERPDALGDQLVRRTRYWNDRLPTGLFVALTPASDPGSGHRRSPR